MLFKFTETAGTMLSRHCAIYIRSVGQAEVMFDRRQQAQEHPGRSVVMRPEQILRAIFSISLDRDTTIGMHDGLAVFSPCTPGYFGSSTDTWTRPQTYVYL